MTAASDGLVWNLLEDGVVAAIASQGERLTLRVHHPTLGAQLPGQSQSVALRLAGVTACFYRPYIEPELDGVPHDGEPCDAERDPTTTVDHDGLPRDIDDIHVIAALGFCISECECTASGQIIVWGEHGSLRLDYASMSVEAVDAQGAAHELSVDALEQAVRNHWDAWRAAWTSEDVHPLVQQAVRGEWSAATLGPLMDAWKEERSSDLASVVCILDAHLHPAPPTVLADPDDLDAWQETWLECPSAALTELADCAWRSFDCWLEDIDLCDQWWDGIWEAFAQVADTVLEPHPRIAVALVDLLNSPSDYWFHLHQVKHVATSFEVEHEHPSFADHVFALLEVHHDAGTPALLEQRAERVLLEADCNGAEMGAKLRQIAAGLRERYPAETDRTLSREAQQALCHRVLVP